jgi:hypothetical protein
MSGHTPTLPARPTLTPVADQTLPDRSAALLAREAASLVVRLRLFTPARWAAVVDPYGTRGDLVHHLAAALVVAAGETAEPLPRLDSDLALPDQLAVTADDLVRVGPAPQVVLDQTAHLLLHRRDLLEEAVPAGLLLELGEPDELALLRRARGVCSVLS